MSTIRSWLICVYREQSVPMEILAKQLKEQAKLLGISNAEAARRIDLDERRYNHYTAGRREPDLATLVKIAETLGTTPNALLGVEDKFVDDAQTNTLINRFVRAAQNMSMNELELCVVQAEAISARKR